MHRVLGYKKIKHITATLSNALCLHKQQPGIINVDVGHIDVVQENTDMPLGTLRGSGLSSAVSSSEGAGMREQLMERGSVGCDAVWQVLGTGCEREETSVPEIISRLSLG